MAELIDYSKMTAEELVEFIDAKVIEYCPEWTDLRLQDPAYAAVRIGGDVAEILLYYVNFLANELFLPTARQRRSVLNLVRTLGYIPRPVTAAQAVITVKNVIAVPIIIPSGTVFRTERQPEVGVIDFVSIEEVEVPPIGMADGLANIDLVQGIVVAKVLQVAPPPAIDPSAKYVLDEEKVDWGSIVITITDVWEKVEHFIDSSSVDEHYMLDYDWETGRAVVVFGDGDFGKIPDAEIDADYRICLGAYGNVGVNKIKVSDIFDADLIWVSATAATGGDNEESLALIKVNAPLSIRTMNRAVTQDDYEYLVNRIPGVAFGHCWSDANTVMVTFAEIESAVSWESVRTVVTSVLAVKKMIGHNIQIQEPTQKRIEIGLVVTIEPDAIIADVLLMIESRLKYWYGKWSQSVDGVYINRFGRDVHLSDVYNLCLVPGVNYLVVSKLAFEGETGINSVLEIDHDAYPYITDALITIVHNEDLLVDIPGDSGYVDPLSSLHFGDEIESPEEYL